MEYSNNSLGIYIYTLNTFQWKVTYTFYTEQFQKDRVSDTILPIHDLWHKYMERVASKGPKQAVNHSENQRDQIFRYSLH